jgi:hypothetical protein
VIREPVETPRAAATAIEHGFVLDEEASATRAVYENDPACDGVPVIAPAALKFSPGGSCPLETDHVYGGCPPLAVRDPEYAWPTTALEAGHVPIARPEVTTSVNG